MVVSYSCPPTVGYGFGWQWCASSAFPALTLGPYEVPFWSGCHSDLAAGGDLWSVTTLVPATLRRRHSDVMTSGWHWVRFGA